MWYHDHTYGMTRLNVYAGEVAGYLLTDPQEEALISSGKIPGASMPAVYRYGIPLIIQDKSFVPKDVGVQDSLWTWGSYGELWLPHVYETNQWPSNPDLSGSNNFGRWDYGPWFWPVFPVNNPVLPQPSGVPEGFMDTMVVNGTAYPYLNVQSQAYRFRILNGSNDRNPNVQLYVADTTVPVGPSGYPSEIKMVEAVPRANCSATVVTNCVCTTSFSPTGCFPSTWPTDGRAGGVPDPATAGPQMIQIGSEGGLLSKPAILPNQPVNYEYNRRSVVVLNVSNKTLFMGPAERADVIIDFSAFAGQTVILYNDAPAPVPAFDPRFDYYTGGPDNTWMGGTPPTAAGYGPNTRTVMQFRVAAGTPAPFTLDSAALTTAYVASQPPPVIPQTTYPAPYSAPTDTYARIQDTSLTFTPYGSTTPVTMVMKSKAIQELFEVEYGRMNSTLGVELPFTTAVIQTTIPYGYIDPTTEMVADGETQIWKITHNGVDTHSVHFHLVNVQVINRVGWDGGIRPPDANELGWKETVRMNPLEDIVVAAKAASPALPFGIPESSRPLDVTCPVGSTACPFTNVDPNNLPIVVANVITNFGWEYVWHCHLLGHEENDMMRPLVMQYTATIPPAPTGLTASLSGSQVSLAWTDPTPPATSMGNAGNEIGFRIERSTGSQAFAVIGTVGANVTTYVDTTVVPSSKFTYRIIGYNAAGNSAASNTAVVTVPGPITGAPTAPSSLTAKSSAVSVNPPSMVLTWKDNSTNETGFLIQRATNSSFTAGITTFTVGAGVTTYTDSTVVLKTKYYYRVLAFNGIGNSAWSGTASATTVGQLPIAPSNLTWVSSTSNSITISWTNNATNQTGFKIQRSSSSATSGFAQVGTTKANTFTYTSTGLSKNKTYWFRVVAYNADGSSAYSNVVAGTTLP